MKKLKCNPRAQFKTRDRLNHSKPLRPDPDQLNADYARWADAALAEFRRQTGADLEDAVSDLLADLMHWCDRFGHAFPEEFRRAMSHHAAETAASSDTTALLSDEL